MKLAKKDVETLICRLIEENLLNEERFAIQFAGGHFRQKKWGKQKIIFALRQKRLGDAIIKKALKEIDGSDYMASLQKLALAKWKILEGEHYLTRQAKTSAFLLQKGYEGPAIQQVIAGIRAGTIV
jgi:regulatory protein